MHEDVAEIHEDPLGVVVTFQRDGALAAQLHDAQDLVANCLNLPLVGPIAKDEEVGERGERAKVEHAEFERLTRLSGANTLEP
jgi:hypothetical protein